MQDQNPPLDEQDQIVFAARVCFDQGRLAHADTLAQHLLTLEKDHPDACYLLGQISLTLEQYEVARDYFQRTLANAHDYKNAAALLQAAVTGGRRATEERSAKIHSTPRFLLIKAWGFGFWSDVDHVIGQLLIAEITGRIPIVHWGANSLFGRGDESNAFELYFAPVSSHTVRDLLQKELSYYPPKWNRHNIMDAEINKWSGPYSKIAGLFFLNRGEDVVVSDFHTHVNDLLHWIPAGHPLFGLSPEAVYRYLFQKYVQLLPDIANQIERFWADRIGDGPTLAVHIRASDKVLEHTDLYAIHDLYETGIRQFLARARNMRIFLLTDSIRVLNDYRTRLGDRVIYTDCVRSEGELGVHHQPDADGHRNGLEIITDTYLACRCGYFLGLGYSNVSTTILHLKEWAPDSFELLGDNRLYVSHFTLQDWSPNP